LARLSILEAEQPPGVQVWNIFGSPVLERFAHRSLSMLKCIQIFEWYVLSHKSYNWLIEKRSIMLMTMTHHDSGMRDMTARGISSGQKWPIFETHRTKLHSVECNKFQNLRR
jgi:hypothetical protein